MLVMLNQFSCLCLHQAYQQFLQCQIGHNIFLHIILHRDAHNIIRGRGQGSAVKQVIILLPYIPAAFLIYLAVLVIEVL
ncbi:hypothetical protein D3C72_2184590 [compost metagenome]